MNVTPSFPARHLLLLLLLVLTPTLHAADRQSARSILERFAKAWRGDAEMRLAEAQSFGMRVAGEGGGEFTVTLAPGEPARIDESIRESVAATFAMTAETLGKIDGGEMNIMTAMARAKASDPAPVSVEFAKGFRWTPAAQALYLPLTFHFFNTGVPEVIPFGVRNARPVHGGLSTIFYYDRGLRTSWYALEPGMHINGDEKDQTNPFRSLVIVTRGRMDARIGGVERKLREGEAILIPENVAHEFWTGKGESAEFVLVMFGDKA